MQVEYHPKKNSCRIVTIRTYPHIKKFIEKFYRTDEEGTVRIDSHTMAGVLIGITLDNKHKIAATKVERMSVEMSLSLNTKNSRKSLTNPVLLQFNIEFDKLFKEQLYNWVIAQSKVGVPVSDAIRNFMKEYKIYEGEYSYDNAYRAWIRYKNDEYNRLKSA